MKRRGRRGEGGERRSEGVIEGEYRVISREYRRERR